MYACITTMNVTLHVAHGDPLVTDKLILANIVTRKYNKSKSGYTPDAVVNRT